MDTNVALVLNPSVAGDVALDIVRVKSVRSHTDRHWGIFFKFAIVFGHNVLPYHSASLAYIEVKGPVVCGDKFVFRKAIVLERVARLLRHARIVLNEVEPAHLIVFMRFYYLGALLVGSVGIFVVHSNKVGTESSAIIAVCLHVGHGAYRQKIRPSDGLEIARKELIVVRIVIVRL